MPSSNRKGESTLAMSGFARPDTHKTLQGYHPDRVSRLRSQLDQAVDEQPTAWQPGIGDELAGTFESWSEGTTRRNERHRIALIRDGQGDLRAVWTFYKVLAAELEQAAPQPGDLVLIRRMPDRMNGEGQPYRVFRVLVDRADDASNPFADRPGEVAR